MGSQKWNRAGQYAAAGASTGAAIGSIVPGYGTLIGGAIGGLAGAVGGFLGGSAEDDNDARRLETQVQQAEQDKARAKKDAYEQFLLGTGAQLMSGGRNAGGAALSNYADYRGQLRGIDREGTAYGRQLHGNYDRMTAYDPNTTVQLGLSLANVAGQSSKALNKPESPPLSAEQFQALGNRSGAPVDMGTSPEVDIMPDPENLQPLRRGRRMGF